MRMGSKGERECSPVEEEGRDECAMSAPRNQDRMVPPSNATPSRGGPAGGGVPVLTESPDFRPADCWLLPVACWDILAGCPDLSLAAGEPVS